jgi:hypothetical protein
MKAMIKKMVYQVAILFAVMVAATSVSAQVPDDIVLSIRTGNSQNLSKYFNENIELVVLENENVYSRAHAEQVVRDFFKKFPPEKFSIIHQGGANDSKYVIGSLQSGTEKFRVYFLLKSRNSAMYIHQLRIETSGE